MDCVANRKGQYSSSSPSTKVLHGLAQTENLKRDQPNLTWNFKERPQRIFRNCISSHDGHSARWNAFHQEVCFVAVHEVGRQDGLEGDGEVLMIQITLLFASGENIVSIWCNMWCANVLICSTMDSAVWLYAVAGPPTMANDQSMELFSSRRWGLDRPKQKAVM